MRDKGQDQPNHSNMTGHEILFGPFIEQLLPFLKRVSEKMKVIKKWFASMVNSPKLLFFLFFAFIFGMWGGYIFGSVLPNRCKIADKTNQQKKSFPI